MAGRAAVASSTASPLSAREGERWWGLRRGVAGNVDRPVGSALQLPSPPGGEGNMAAGGLGVYPLSKRGGLLTMGVSSELGVEVSSELGMGVSSKLGTGVSNKLGAGLAANWGRGLAANWGRGLAANWGELRTRSTWWHWTA